MASGWATGLPRISVPRGTIPKRVTLIVPYYESPAFLKRQFEHWTHLPADLQVHLTVIVVDDGSPRWPAEIVTADWRPAFTARLFRIDVDVPWNWLAARNIGAHYAEDGWLLLTDMDHVVPAETLESVIFGQHDPAMVYAFSRREHTGQSVAPHSASFLMTRAMFWTIGGYDERLSGAYGTDGLYRKRIIAHAPIRVLTDALIHHEYVADASVTTYERKTPRMEQARRQRLAAVSAGPPRVLSFLYHEVPR